MKNKSIYCLSLITIFFISMTGCESVSKTFEKDLGVMHMQSQRPVENNLFTSTFPELKLQINREFKYLGSVELDESIEDLRNVNFDPREQSFDATAYLFGQMDPRKRITRGVLIRMLVTHGDPSRPIPELFTEKNNHILESGQMQILKEKYQYNLYTEQDLFTPKEKALLRNSRIPSCLLVKQLAVKAGLGNKSRIHVIYFEDVSSNCGKQSCGTCLDPKRRTAEQKQFLQEFTDRSFASIRFRETKTIEDTTSRYVDTVPKAQPAPAGTAPATESIKADTLEKRLEALKKVYERNLISQEEYEKKKAEILNEL